MLIDVEENLTVGAAGSPPGVVARWYVRVAVVVVEVDVATILARAGVRVTRAPSGLEFASGHPLCGGAYVKRQLCQRTFGYGGTISVTNADPKPWLLSVLARKVGVGS